MRHLPPITLLTPLITLLLPLSLWHAHHRSTGQGEVPRVSVPRMAVSQPVIVSERAGRRVVPRSGIVECHLMERFYGQWHSQWLLLFNKLLIIKLPPPEYVAVSVGQQESYEHGSSSVNSVFVNHGRLAMGKRNQTSPLPSPCCLWWKVKVTLADWWMTQRQSLAP